MRKIDLIQKASTEASQYYDNRQRFVLDGLLKMKAAASDIQKAIRLFQEVDADNSGRYFNKYTAFCVVPMLVVARHLNPQLCTYEHHS